MSEEIREPCMINDYDECEHMDEILDENNDFTCEDCDRFIYLSEETKDWFRDQGMV